MRAFYRRATGLPDVVRVAGELRARTMVFDVEPLVAHWNGGQDELNRGIGMVLDGLAGLSELEVVCFATNSKRRPSILPCRSGRRVIYLSSALKPLRTAPYRSFPRPGMLIGDQIATDGILARLRLCALQWQRRRRSARAPAPGRLREASPAIIIQTSQLMDADVLASL